MLWFCWAYDDGYDVDFTALLIYLPTLKHCMLYGFLVVYDLLQLFKFDGKIWLWAFIAIEAILL